MFATPTLSTAELARLWEAGQTDELFLDSNQMSIRDHLLGKWDEQRIHVFNMSRQLGKSVFLTWLADKLCRMYPGFRVKYAAQSAKQVRAIVRPHFADLHASCPIHLRPEFNTQDGEYRYPNGSTITVAGCETENDANRLLGQHADLFIVDEAGSIKILNYVVKTIALPQTLNTNGRIIICSTPAKTPDHPFKEFCDQAEARGCLIERTIYDNPRISAKVIQELMEDSGGEDSTEWEREYLVKHVTDQDLKIIKTATESLLKRITLTAEQVIGRSYRPRFFQPYVGIDIGFSPDFTGIVWGYLDFGRDTLVIEKDFMMRRMDTALLAEVVVEGEMSLWGTTKYTLRYADTDERLIVDLQNKHNLSVVRTQRDNKQGAVNNLTLAVGGKVHNVQLHPDCKDLRKQLEVGVWDKNKKKFARSARHGHYDVLDAGITLARNVIWDVPPAHATLDPIPRGHYPGMLALVEKEKTVVGALKSAFGLD